MGGMTPEDRCKVPIRYKEKYKKDLVDVMRKEVGNSDVSVVNFTGANLFADACRRTHRMC